MKFMKKVLCVIMSVLMIGSTMIFAGAENETKAADTVTGFTDEDYLVVKGRSEDLASHIISAVYHYRQLLPIK